MQPRKILFAIAVLTSTVVFASDQSTKDFGTESAVAKAMAAQRSGDIASDKEQHLSGKARVGTYKRYVESFAQPIPQSFVDTSFSDKK